VAKCDIVFDYNNSEVFEEEFQSPSFPGVHTVYRKEIVQGTIKGPSATWTEDRFVTGYTWNFEGTDGSTRSFKWMEVDECEKDDKLQYKAPEDLTYSALVNAPIGWNEEELTKFLTQNKVDVSKYAQEGKTVSLQQFSAELVQGDSALSQEGGEIVRIVDSVLLKLVSQESGKILILSDQTSSTGETVELNRLPTTMRRPDENYFLSARRIICKQLKLDTNHVTIDPANLEDVEKMEDVPAYPGVRTLHRRKTITAYLGDKDE